LYEWRRSIFDLNHAQLICRSGMTERDAGTTALQFPGPVNFSTRAVAAAGATILVTPADFIETLCTVRRRPRRLTFNASCDTLAGLAVATMFARR
jgi:hypothetical protein